MEQEYFFSGYCRTIDDSRMVTVELKDHTLTDVDCCYGHCVYIANCTIAQKIRELTKQ